MRGGAIGVGPGALREVSRAGRQGEGESQSSAVQDVGGYAGAAGFIGGHDYMDYFEGCVKAVDEVVGKPDKIFRDYSWIKRI